MFKAPKSYTNVVSMQKSTLPVLATVDGWPVNIRDQQAPSSEIIAAPGWPRASRIDIGHGPSAEAETARRRFLQPPCKSPLVTRMTWLSSCSLASRLDPRIRRTTGADLVVPLAVAAARNDIPVYLFGTSNSVLERASARLAQETNLCLRVAGTEAPEQGFDPEGPAADLRSTASRPRERSCAS